MELQVIFSTMIFMAKPVMTADRAILKVLEVGFNMPFQLRWISSSLIVIAEQTPT
jgi:hypothetical protein